MTAEDRKRLGKLISKVSCVLGCRLDSVVEVGENGLMAKLLTIMKNTFPYFYKHPDCPELHLQQQATPPAVCEGALVQVCSHETPQPTSLLSANSNNPINIV